MKMEDEFKIEIEMEQKMCSDCKKSSTEYYELLLQLRFLYFEDMSIIKNKILTEVLETFKTVNKLEERDNGFDIYFRTHGIMNKIYSMFSKYYLVDEKRSKKLIGRDQLISKDKYRYFQSIILVNLSRGDQISVKGQEYWIKAINNNKELVLINCKTFDKSVLNYSIIKDYLKLIEKDAKKF
jgi:NMD protein affecting ribosome stability and mRNA decay